MNILKKTIFACLIGLIILASGIAGWRIFKPNLTEAGKVVFKRNVIVRAFYKPTLNGSMSTSTDALLSQANGGVDDYNNNQTMPTDSYVVSWTACAAGNNWCNTATSTANAKDNSTGLVWSNWLVGGASKNWFWANNCKYPNELPGDDAVCNVNGEIACRCVKLISSKTGCEALDGNWRLPHQKELMQVYIDGSRGNLSSPGYNYWSATTRSTNTHYAWSTSLGTGYTYFDYETTTLQVPCVR